MVETEFRRHPEVTKFLVTTVEESFQNKKGFFFFESSESDEILALLNPSPPWSLAVPFAEVRVREFAMPSEDWMSVSVLRPEVRP